MLSKCSQNCCRKLSFNNIWPSFISLPLYALFWWRQIQPNENPTKSGSMVFRYSNCIKWLGIRGGCCLIHMDCKTKYHVISWLDNTGNSAKTDNYIPIKTQIIENCIYYCIRWGKGGSGKSGFTLAIPKLFFSQIFQNKRFFLIAIRLFLLLQANKN